MNSTLPAKSQEHESRIKEISEIIVNAAKDKIALLILFGSFARGTWIHDRYVEGGILYEESLVYKNYSKNLPRASYSEVLKIKSIANS